MGHRDYCTKYWKMLLFFYNLHYCTTVQGTTVSLSSCCSLCTELTQHISRDVDACGTGYYLTPVFFTWHLSTNDQAYLPAINFFNWAEFAVSWKSRKSELHEADMQKICSWHSGSNWRMSAYYSPFVVQLTDHFDGPLNVMRNVSMPTLYILGQP